MGKVYDALQRAEEQRSRLAGDPASIEAASRVDPLPAPAGARTPRADLPKRAFWRRWLPKRRPEVDDVGAVNKRRIALLQPQSFCAEQFRTLRARLDSLAATHPLRTIAVTSANPGDGKTMASINLALVTSMSVGRQVVLVDCDLRRPRIHESLGLRVEAGLGEVLRGVAELDDALLAVDASPLRVLPVRSLPPNPSELLASGAMRELVGKLVARFDRVILDLPPLIGLPDAKVVCDLCDGILMVVRAHETPREEVEAALELIDRSRLLGVVLNEADAVPERYGYSS
jgi:capsular exopolysaccharide synthesis family protein